MSDGLSPRDTHTHLVHSLALLAGGVGGAGGEDVVGQKVDVRARRVRLQHDARAGRAAPVRDADPLGVAQQDVEGAHGVDLRARQAQKVEHVQIPGPPVWALRREPRTVQHALQPMQRDEVVEYLPRK